MAELSDADVGLEEKPKELSDADVGLGESIGPSDLSAWQKFRTGTVGRKLFGPTDIEREGMAGGVSGSQVGLIEIPQAMLKMTSLGLPPVRKAVETVTDPLIEALPAAPRGIAKGVREFALDVPLAPIPGVTGPKTAIAALSAFGGQYLSELPDAYKQFQQAVSMGDVEGASKIAAEAGLGGALLAFGAAHGISKLKKPVEKGISDATQTRIEQESRQPEHIEAVPRGLPAEAGGGNRPVGTAPQPEAPVPARPGTPPDKGVNAVTLWSSATPKEGEPMYLSDRPEDATAYAQGRKPKQYQVSVQKPFDPETSNDTALVKLFDELGGIQEAPRNSKFIKSLKAAGYDSVIGGESGAGGTSKWVVSYDPARLKEQPEPTVESVTPLEPQSGAPLVGLGGALAEGEPQKAALAQLTDSVKTLAESSPAHDKATQAFDLGEKFDRTKDSATQGLEGLKSAWEYTKQRFIGKPVWTDYKAAVGDRGLALSESAQNSRKWVKLAQKAVPNELDQEAISNYIDTGGNADILTQAAEQTKPRYRAGYLRAADLDPNLKTVAENAKNYFESRLQDAVDAGILEDGIEDYIHRTYEKDSPWKQGVIAELRSGIFTGRPAFAKQRAFQYDFEAERAGLRPVKSFTKRIASYEMSLNKAIADRKIVKDLTQIKMPDGRPMIDVAGSGTKIEDPSGATEATLIRPSARKTTTTDLESNRGDYKYYDHPALRRWKWATNDPNGKPIFVQGDVLVHPDAMRQIESLFGKSAVRKNPVGRLALGAGSTIKQTMLDLSLFHPTQITVHGWEHRTFKPVREIDFTDPETRGLIRGGLVVGDTHGHQLFSEGLSGSSLTKHIPILGKRAQAYQDWLFNDYIPRLKVATGKHALARNRDSFPNLSEDQLNHLTANQMNAAFGELNYEMLGRNKTTQDLLRIALLAPDFLEARARFTAQAGTLYGREQLKALTLGAVTLYLTARIINKLLDDEYHFEPKNAFSIVHGKRAYSLRTVQGDLLHLATSPMQFLYSRLNPVYGRTAMEAVTGRDYFGRKRTGLEQLRDFAKTIVPISLRGLLNPREQKLWESFLNSVGITERRNTNTDTIYKLADDFKKSAKIKGEPGEFIYDPEKDPYRSIKLALAYETPEKAAQEMAVAIRDGRVTYPQMAKYFQQYGKKPFTGSKKNEALFIKSLSTDQKKIYNDAVTERQKMRQNASVALGEFRQQLMRERAEVPPNSAEPNPFQQ